MSMTHSEGHIEPAREIKLFAFRANEVQFDRIASTEFKDAALQVGEEVELLSQRFNGCDAQALARQIGCQDAGSGADLEHFHGLRIEVAVVWNYPAPLAVHWDSGPCGHLTQG